MNKCKGGCQMKAGGKTCAKCGCDMSPKKMAYGGEAYKSGGIACMKCGGKMHKSGGKISSCMKCGGGKYTFGGKTGWMSKKKVTKKYSFGGAVESAKKYQNGGPVDPKKKEQEMLLKSKGWPMPTKQDSIYAAQKAQAVLDYYNNENYDLKKFNRNIPLDYLKKILDDDYNYHKNMESKITVPGTFATKLKYPKDVEYRKKQNPNNPWIIEQRESANFILDTRAPMQYYDLRIAPTERSVGSNKNKLDMMHGDNVTFYNYDPVAVTPFSMRTPEQHAEYQRKYGPYDKTNEATIGMSKNPPPPQMEYKDTVAGQLEAMGIKPTFENRQKIAKDLGYENYSGTMDQNIQLLKDIQSGMLNKTNNQNQEVAIVESEDEAAGPTENVMLQPSLKPENINPSPNNAMPVKKTPIYFDPTKSRYDSKYLEEMRKRGAIWPGMNFGGAVKKYRDGGMAKDESIVPKDMMFDFNMPAGINVSDSQYNINSILGTNILEDRVETQPVNPKDLKMQNEIIESNKNEIDNKSLPNWGRAKKEQQKLNELIRKDISLGKTNMDLLVEDDIIGSKTLAAMNAYEGKGYTRPELFKDKWIAEYKKNAKAGIGIGGAKLKVPKINKQESDSVPKINIDKSPKTNIIEENVTEKNDNKTNENKRWWMTDAVEKIINKTESEKNIEKESLTKGWPKSYLLKNKGIEIDIEDLKSIDGDTYQTIKSLQDKKITKGKSMRITQPGKSFAKFDAAEKNQYYYTKDNQKVNTANQYFLDVLSKSKKAILVPSGYDSKYDRDLMQLYIRNEDNPNLYHAYDSLGVVGGEAMYGMYKETSKMDERQAMITKQADEKGGFKYPYSPYMFRQIKNTGDNVIKTDQKTVKEENAKTFAEKKKFKTYKETSEYKTKAGKEAAMKDAEAVAVKAIPANASRSKTTLIVDYKGKKKSVTVNGSFSNIKNKEIKANINGKEVKIFVDPNIM